MKHIGLTLSAAIVALVLVGCGDPADFEDVPDDEMMQQDDGGGTGSGF